MNDKIIERIKKMFALANDDGAAAGEAENAMRMANKLMERHALSAIDLHTNEEIRMSFEPYHRNAWSKQVYNSIAELYSCEFISHGTRRNLIIGADSDSRTASIVARALIENIERAGEGERVAFRNGAALEIVRQCDAIMESRKNNPETVVGTGLVLCDVLDAKLERAKQFMHAEFGVITQTSSRMQSNEKGRAYGATLSPNAHLSNRKALN